MTDEPRPAAATEPASRAETYDACYFEHCCGQPYRRDEHWTGFFSSIADRIVGGIHPKRVLDAGCAMGLLVEALRDRGVDAEGIDISSHAIASVFEPIRLFCRQGSIADELSARYDLIVTIEVLEHLPAHEGDAVIANICRHTDDVLFSSTPFDQQEPTHVNVQRSEYWAERFARHGFFRDVDFDASFVTPWAVRFRQSGEPLPRVVRNYERRLVEALERLAPVEARLASVEHQLAYAQATIANMERSAFWKIRSLWVAVSRLAGRSADGNRKTRS